MDGNPDIGGNDVIEVLVALAVGVMLGAMVGGTYVAHESEVATHALRWAHCAPVCKPFPVTNVSPDGARCDCGETREAKP